ncbi:hypothetical protein FTO70_11945 [Methanosarcina sp. KYL-1]|uniref:hypothetical protein n=1 Tax=Methanosarcina sp. KYL-1 TaxID=2602068 RepID=UPI002100B783|nr:hypothetical protein [Methanosarcina sp. KYL-1]MCQ1536372.1 hypothetical protein [Methanosarcina sp. KYL-1]
MENLEKRDFKLQFNRINVIRQELILTQANYLNIPEKNIRIFRKRPGKTGNFKLRQAITQKIKRIRVWKEVKILPSRKIK